MDWQSQKFRFRGADKVEPERESRVRIGRGMWKRKTRPGDKALWWVDSVKWGGEEFSIPKQMGGLPWGVSGKEPACQCRRSRFSPGVEKIPGRMQWQPTPVFLPGKSHGRRSLEGYTPRGHKESDVTEQLNNNPMGWTSRWAVLSSTHLIWLWKPCSWTDSVIIKLLDIEAVCKEWAKLLFASVWEFDLQLTS